MPTGLVLSCLAPILVQGISTSVKRLCFRCSTVCVCSWQSAGPVPDDFELVGARKGFSRYRSARQTGLVAVLAAAQEQREAALASILQVFARPGERHGCHAC